MSKSKTLILVMFFLLSFCIANVHAKINNQSLLGRVIYLDAGHGGPDSGAISGNVLEKDINLQIVQNLEAILTSKGAVVLLTRSGDYELSTSKYNRKRKDLITRAEMINKSNCDLYLSIHLNSTTNSTWKGLQIFYNSNNKENKLLAETLNQTIKDNISNVRKTKEANDFLLTRKIIVPGVLIEAGFLSNPDDLYLLRQEEYQNKLSQIIVKGIENYLQKK